MGFGYLTLVKPSQKTGFSLLLTGNSDMVKGELKD